MKRIAVAFAILLVVIGCLIAALPFFVSSDAVRNRIITKLGDLTGRTVSFTGNPTVSFSPFLGIELSNLIVEDPNTTEDGVPLLKVEKVQVQLELLSALIGNISFNQYRLVRPQLHLKTYTDGVANWRFERGLIHDALDGGSTSSPEAKLGIYTLVDGVINYENVISDSMEEIRNINATLEWPNTSDPSYFEGSGIWRGENISLSSNVTGPASLFAGGISDLSFDFASAPISIQYSGSANMISDLFLIGEISATTPSIERMSNFLGLNFGDFGTSGEWKVSGNLEGTTNSAKLTTAIVSIAGYEGTGALSLSINEFEKAKLSGTLAFEAIDLSSQLAEKQTVSETVLDANQVEDLEMDLRVSANAIQLSQLALNNVAASIAMKSGSWVFDIGYSEALGGTIISKIGERIENEQSQSFLEVSARGIDASQLSEMIENRVLTFTGKANIDANLRTKTLGAGIFSDGLNGTLDATLNNGAINGIDLNALLRQPDQAETELSANGSTSFSEISIATFINSGVASIAQSHIMTNSSKIQLIGDISFVDNGLEVRAQEVTDTGPESTRLLIGGTLLTPLVAVQKPKAN